jgi:hypothetical protein
MNCLSGLGDHSVESIVMVCGIMDCACCTVGLQQAVVALNFVTNTLLCLLLDVVGMAIINSVFKFVISRSLDKIFY